MIDGLQFAIITRPPHPVTSQLLLPPSSFHIAMQGYIIHYSCNSETILCKIHRINRKDSFALTKSILNFNLTTIHQLQLPQNRAIVFATEALFPQQLYHVFLCSAVTFGVQVLSFYVRIYLVLYQVI